MCALSLYEAMTRIRVIRELDRQSVSPVSEGVSYV